ncbi:MAG: Rne/Rng family ribonuclease [Desulfovibrionaceae bacterium]|nr:Rne/Rng family ribonuclease [Desulfovibrionaceae bacterium]
MAEEDLEALDEAVNGNRIDAPGPDKGRGRKAARPARPARSSRPAPPAAKAAEPAESAPEAPAGKRVLYMSVVPDEQVEVVITDNGQVTEYFVEMAHQAKIRGNIYKGVINNIDTNLQAAFVNFGGGKNGFLQIDEVHPEYWLTPHEPGKGPKYPPIQKVLKVGQEVLVQVVKEPSGTKGAFLTTWVSLAGRFLVLTPGQEQIGVSRKVEDPEERTRLKELLAGIDPGENMGVIIRTASEGAGKTSIQKDLQFLKRLWKDIRKRVGSEKSPCLIYQEADLASRVLRDYLADDIREIWVDDESTLESIRETSGLLFPRRQDIIKLHRDPRHTLWERFNLQRQLEEVASREVILPSGGRLVFDQTEALMAIDINSGKTQGKSNFEAMVFRTNMEAAEAIARHLRLRDIGGQVVIDFIEMRDRNHCREVEKVLRNAMRLDRARHDVGRMSSFGLLELVRQRTGTSAISISSEPCPYCRGTGVRRNMEWQALHALRELQSKLVKSLPAEAGKNRKGDSNGKNGHAGGVFVYDAEPELGLYLLNKKRDRLTELEGRFGVAIEIRLKPCVI